MNKLIKLGDLLDRVEELYGEDSAEFEDICSDYNIACEILADSIEIAESLVKAKSINQG